MAGRSVRTSFAVAAIALSALLPAGAAAHVERSSYWPDPAPDCSVTPCAGGAVPKARSLSSALNRKAPGDTRVVCRPESLTLARQSIARARRQGYDVRPTDHRTLSARQARLLLRINRRLYQRCRYHEIQPAVTNSHNNDRVVVMPGLYTEPTARAQPTHDKRCDPYKTHSDSGDPGALSHSYQLHCPNDANLVAVIGRGEGPGKDPDPAPEDRHGIPNLGPCIRCNLQLEGSGVSADDVVLEAGDPKAGNGGPSAAGHEKDVGLFVDQADGFVLRKLTVRHAAEHDIYILESDGYRFDQFKTFYAGGYGVLTFVEDHGLIENCEAAGNGDSGIYPGAGAKTNAGRDVNVYPEPRYSQEIRDCDSHHNTGGYSGTNGNATHVVDNDFYDNALGFTTDVFTAPGHPGFPQQGDLVEGNRFYDNNFNPYVAGSDVKPYIPAPVGTGLWIAGGNDNVVRANRFYDNHRRGVMLFAAPDATVCGPIVGSDTPVPGCEPTKVSTSYNNSFTQNVMGVAPGGEVRPNGTDFWWDNFPGNTGNCWWGNTAAPGRQVTTSPMMLPDCAGGTDPSRSIGTGDAANEGELVGCLAGFTFGDYPNGNSTICSWTTTPAKPGAAAAADGSAIARQRRAQLQALCDELPQNRTCAPLGGPASATGRAAPQPPVSFEGAWAGATAAPGCRRGCSPAWRASPAAAPTGARATAPS
ncbi:MAG: right-handed parallel beta-helix repeat-containing protein [Solirubrobacterales bacterium]|nr:right-handed parallel beta-helix repeat-containing protein [Solirubrobacterales bacterium]